MEKSDVLLSLGIGAVAAVVPPETLAAVPEIDGWLVSLFFIKAAASGFISLGVTYFGKRIIRKLWGER